MKVTSAAAVLVVAGLTVLLSGCATPDPGDQGSPHDHGPPAPAASLFISPSGQPFRAAPGEPYPVAKWFAQADKNGDGHLDRAEFRADAEAFFHILDANHDGVIDGFELNDYEQKIAPEVSGAYGGDSGESMRHRAAGERRRGGSQGPRGSGANSAAVLQGGAVFSLLADPEPVAAADLDLSGRITLKEWLEMADRRFDRLDAKQLGYLTLDGLPKTAAQTMGMSKKRRGGGDQSSGPKPGS
jgi:hypothetical protein